MKKLRTFIVGITLAAVASITVQSHPGTPQTENASHSDSMEIRLRRLEDREAIRRLLVDYGRTLDNRDFDGFERLFARNAEYIGGAASGATKGPAAIRKLLESVIEENPTGFRSPNFHLFANVTIQVNGDEAVAQSKGVFVVPGEDNIPEIVMLATYNDVLIRENGIWKFKRREVRAGIPAPRENSVPRNKP